MSKTRRPRLADAGLLSLAGRGLAGLSVRAPWQAELYLRRERYRDVVWAQGRPKDTRSGLSQGAALRGVRGARQGFAFGSETSPESVRALWTRVRDAIPFMPRDRHRGLYAPVPASRNGAGRVGRNGPGEEALFSRTVQGLQDRLAQSEKRLLRSDRRIKKALELAVRESEVESAVVSTAGVAVSHRFRSVSLSLELMGEDRGEVQVSWEYAARRGWEDLPWDAVLDEARDRLLGSFRARPLRSGQWPVIFPSRIGSEFLELWAEAAGADAVQEKRSFLAGRRGGQVASDLVTLVDDGRYPGGLATASHDDEGCPTGRTVVAERGRLREFLYDSYAARREGRSSTGNGLRDGVEGPPSPDITNFYMQAGTTPLADLLGEPRRAFRVEEVMGLHTADTVSGDFSVGATGTLLENGRPVRAVRGVTLAGNLLELFRRVEAVAADLTWHGSVGSPTFRVSGLSIGGD